MLKKYFNNLAIGWLQLLEHDLLPGASLFYRLDLFANAVLLGDPQETISSRCGKYLHAGGRGVVWVLCKLLSIIDPARGNHCIENMQPREGSDELVRLDVLLIVAALGTGAWWLV